MYRRILTKILIAAVLTLSLTYGRCQVIEFRTFGVPDCGEWFTTRHNSSLWLMGFLTGRNLSMRSNPLAALNSADQALLWMDNYCRANPLGSVIDGAGQLLNELDKRPRR